MSTVCIGQVLVGDSPAEHIPGIQYVGTVPEWFTSSASVQGTTMVVNSLASTPNPPSGGSGNRQVLTAPAKSTKWHITNIGSDALYVAECVPGDEPTNATEMKAAGCWGVPANSVLMFGVGKEGNRLIFLQV